MSSRPRGSEPGGPTEAAHVAQHFSSLSLRKAREGFRGQRLRVGESNTVRGLATGETQILYKHVIPSPEALRIYYVSISQVRKLRLRLI